MQFVRSVVQWSTINALHKLIEVSGKFTGSKSKR